MSSYRALAAQFAVQQEDVASLQYQLGEARAQCDGAINLAQATMGALQMAQATSERFLIETQRLKSQLLSCTHKNPSEDTQIFANLKSPADVLQQAAIDNFGRVMQTDALTWRLDNLQQEKEFAEENAARWQRHYKEAEEQRDILEQAKHSAEGEAAYWKLRCKEAEKEADGCLAQLDRLRQRVSGKSKLVIAGDSAEADGAEPLPTPEELAAERAHNEARLGSYQNHMEDLEQELIAATSAFGCSRVTSLADSPTLLIEL